MMNGEYITSKRIYLMQHKKNCFLGKQLVPCERECKKSRNQVLVPNKTVSGHGYCRGRVFIRLGFFGFQSVKNNLNKFNIIPNCIVCPKSLILHYLISSINVNILHDFMRKPVESII